MDDPSRIEQRHWSNLDPTHLKDLFQGNPAWKWIGLISERDAAIAERDTAMAEKRIANAERDAALLQRDVAYADRDSAWNERNKALAALTVITNIENADRATKLMQMVDIPGSSTAVDPLAVSPLLNSGFGNVNDTKKKQTKKVLEGTSKRKEPVGHINYENKKARALPKDRQHVLHPDMNFKFDNGKGDSIPKPHRLAAKPSETFSTPIPYCSCTGTNQQCYRWGKGGWQSACCTNLFSMYPLPMSHTKRGARVPGRKMSGGAFKKILEKLAADGVDISIPIDLKSHWAKHGTNRYVTIK